MEKFTRDFNRAVELKKLEMAVEEAKLGLQAMYEAGASIEKIKREINGVFMELQERLGEMYRDYLKDLSTQMGEQAER